VFAPGFLPVPFSPDNYVEAWRSVPLVTWLFNSLVVGAAAATAVTISSAWVAFGFAYFRFPGRNLLFGLVLATMMLPFAVTMIPTYLVWSKLGLTDTQVPFWAGMPRRCRTGSGADCGMVGRARGRPGFKPWRGEVDDGGIVVARRRRRYAEATADGGAGRGEAG
jgi:ABC-type Fe3+ transport system permease subunit